MAQDHLFYMNKVLELANNLAQANIEVPIAALIVRDDTIISEGLNNREKNKSILGHAEIQAMELAAKALGDWNLSDCTLYVNLEPCAMCAGAILQSHIGTIVYAAADPKAGALGSRYNLVTNKLQIISGILEEESKNILKKFFANKRPKSNG
jgi:tRNA(adenine34) deaminase